jgi:hypothetical protein
VIERQSSLRRFKLLFLVIVSATASCAKTNEKPSIPTAPTKISPTVDAQLDANQLVKLLVREPERVASFLDIEFLNLLTRAGGDDPTDIDFAAQLRAVIAAVPEDCDLRFEQDEGYSAISIPPPMTDQSPEQCALIETAVEGLRKGEEVLVYCRRKTAPKDSEAQDELLFGLNLFRGHIRAWRTR